MQLIRLVQEIGTWGIHPISALPMLQSSAVITLNRSEVASFFPGFEEALEAAEVALGIDPSHADARTFLASSGGR